MTFKQLSTSILLAGSLAACDRTSPISPGPPLGQQQAHNPPAVTTYTVSGVVSEMTATGLVPLSGVLVRETLSFHSSRTDDQGSYSIAGVPPRSAGNTISAGKTGYTTGTVTQAIGGDTRVDLQLERRPTYTLSGVISEITATGLVPIEGVTVEFLSWVGDDNYAYGETPTDAQGRYRLPGFWSGSDVYTEIWLTKAGYRIDPQMNPSCDRCFRTLTITGDTVLDIQLERLPDAGGMSARTFQSTSRVR